MRAHGKAHNACTDPAQTGVGWTAWLGGGDARHAAAEMCGDFGSEEDGFCTN